MLQSRNENRLALKKVMTELLMSRGQTSTICPSEVARNCFPDDWRMYMDLVRDIACELVYEGKAVIMKKGEIISPDEIHGPIRIRKA